MNKKNLKLAIILIILVALAYLYQGPFQKWKSDFEKPKNIFSGLNIEKTDKITIARNKATTTLEKTGDRWKVGGTKDFYVNKNFSDELVKVLQNAKAAGIELVSANKDKKTDFSVDEIKGTKVILSQEGKQQTGFIIGKIGSDYASTYISQPGNNNTYTVKEDFISAFIKPDWRDNVIFSGTKDKISKVRIQNLKNQIIIENKDGKWAGTAPGKFSVNKDKVDKILDIMSSLVAQSIPEQNFKSSGLEKSTLIVEASGDGIDNTIMVGKDNGKGEFYVKNGNSDNIYLITKEQKNTLDKTVTSLK